MIFSTAVWAEEEEYHRAYYTADKGIDPEPGAG
jgi:hypothetical protein